MYQLKKNQRGFTIIELLVVIAIIGILASVVILALNASREKGENASIISAVREYNTALQLVYKENGEEFPAYRVGVASDLNQYRCLTDVNGDDSCNYNGTTIGLYDSLDPSGMAILDQMIKRVPLDVVVYDAQSEAFDSIMYSSNAHTYRLRYALKGDGVDCGFGDAYEINAGSNAFAGVTVCVYEAR